MPICKSAVSFLITVQAFIKKGVTGEGQNRFNLKARVILYNQIL